MAAAKAAEAAAVLEAELAEAERVSEEMAKDAPEHPRAVLFFQWLFKAAVFLGWGL